MNFDLDFALRQFPNIARQTHMTLFIAVLSMMLALVLSLAILLVRHYRVRGLYRVTGFYIAFFRGTPLVTQLFFLYYGLAQLIPAFRALSGFWAAVIGLGLNASAYMAENLRGAVESVGKGQVEAGLSCGLTRLQIMRHVILPQAATVALPVLTNDFIALIKNSSLAFVLGVRDIMAQTAMIGSSAYRYFECYFDAIVIYFAIVSVVTWLQKKLEARVAVGR